MEVVQIEYRKFPLGSGLLIGLPLCTKLYKRLPELLVLSFFNGILFYTTQETIFFTSNHLTYAKEYSNKNGYQKHGRRHKNGC